MFNRLSIASLLFVSATLAGNCFGQDEEAQTFNSLKQTLKQLVRTDVDDEGRWRLKRDHWELVSKRPSEAEREARKKQKEQMEKNIERWRRANIPEDQIERMSQRRGVETQGLVRLVQRLGVESGGYLGFQGSGQMNNVKHGNIENQKLTGRVEYNANSELQGTIRFDLQETTGKHRSLSIQDDEDETRLMLRGPGQLLLLERTSEAARVILAGSGPPLQLVGNSMTDIAKQNTDVLRAKINPVLTDFGAYALPIDAILQATPKEADEPKLRELKFEFDELERERTFAALKPLLRFRLGKHLEINDFFGSTRMLEKEMKRVKEEYKKTLDAAVARLKDAGAPESQINELRAQLGGFDGQQRNDDPFGRPRGFAGFGRAFGGIIGGRQSREKGEVKAFRTLQNSVGNVGSSSSSGGTNYEYTFSGSNVEGKLKRAAKQYRFKASDSGATVSITDLDGYVELSVKSTSGLLIVTQTAEGPASAMLLGGENPWFASAASYLDLLKEHGDEFRKNILPLTTKLGISGLDPLSTETQQAVVSQLRKGVPERLSTRNSVAEADSIVFPLLENKLYLTLLAEKLDGDDKALVEKRIGQVK